MGFEPETYFLGPNKHCPNNDMPVLIYRDCLPLPLSEAKTTEFLEAHAWEKKGTWGHIAYRHFHPNTHECYGVFQGESRILVGCGTNDTAGGEEIEVHAGDVIVLPAGTGHCSLQSSKDYRYIGVYPEGAPKWRSELGKDEVGDSFRQEIQGVALPVQDPVNGSEGPLLKLWTKT
ncbi:uncharacterized protein PV07_11264 [Cladophialophora immunda]|uniref:Cupin type-2 domain-containing protein n=1 Tax=Cladophialophora immunda TaxID=569365 RepID=A0A0D2ADT0_9EURO|nr:uncharacterized protein PV07_11264 [Cladophialophora immunda]KIW23032.1 hypothetical protein PV07_11264 [Cladophialophora immunda]OQU93678.1 Cupin domain-containing protein [Cladophialophora immunda]